MSLRVPRCLDVYRDLRQLLFHQIRIHYSGEHEKEDVPPRPLSFDRVNEGRAAVSEARLFKLPVEIITQILESLSQPSLAPLALVCRDARQLARSRQFASIKLDCSAHSVALVKKLVAEANIRKSSYGGSKNISQSLGVCVRRITVAPNPFRIPGRGDILYRSGFSDLRMRTEAERLVNAGTHFLDEYLPRVLFLLGSNVVFPHLESLDWRDTIIMPPSLLERLPYTSIQHLRLFRVRFKEGFEIKYPELLKVWPLRTLYLDVVDMDMQRPSLMCASILRRCASTLESLTWQASPRDPQRYSFATYTMDSAPQFPSLRSLILKDVAFSDYSILDALLEGDLRELEVNLGQDSLFSEFFDERGTMPALTTLVWNAKIKAEQTIRFLQANSHLSKLSLEREASTVFLENQLLPLLAKSFQCLTSLCLKLDSDLIPGSMLEAIGSLKSLQQLHVSAGHQHGSRYSWFINHELMRSRLKNLTSLRRMAFSRDIYDNEVDWSAPERYYEDVRDIDWETCHRESMWPEMRLLARTDQD